MTEKEDLRRQMRSMRREHVAAIPDQVRALLFKRPPEQIVGRIAKDSVIGLYAEKGDEARASAYARFFCEEGFTIALPRIVDGNPAMQFHLHVDPFGSSDLEDGPFGIRQPLANAEPVTPDTLFVPLLAFTDQGHRLGQGGGFYDRWLAAHPGTVTFGLGWDCQKLESLPVEPHDAPLDAVITPTRLYGPF